MPQLQRSFLREVVQTESSFILASMEYIIIRQQEQESTSFSNLKDMSCGIPSIVRALLGT